MVILLLGLLREAVPVMLRGSLTTGRTPAQSSDDQVQGGRGPPVVSPEGMCAANLIQESPAGCWYLVRAPGMGN